MSALCCITTCQKTSRAITRRPARGRDGQPADCILLYGGKDVVTNRFFIEKDDENDALDEETRRLVREKDEERLRRMTF